MASNHRTYTYTLSDGVQLSLTDGGPPPNSKDYTTVFVIHGTAFNAYQFRKLHQHAHFFNLRTVALHRRDYAGSTPYTHTELEEIQRGDRVFWDRLSAQLAEVLNVFIERENIPKLTVIGNRRSGGIAIMGWSFGCTTLLSLLGSAENPRISNKLCDLLEQYIGECVLYDPPYQALGYPLPSDNPNQTPWLDSTLSLLELPPVFTKWIGSYFDHRCYDPSIKSLSATATIHDLDGARLYSDKEEDISTTSWTEDDLIRGIEREAGGRDTLLALPRAQQTIQLMAKQALYDQESARSWFPNTEITYIGCTRTSWVCAWAEIETKRRYNNGFVDGVIQSDGQTARRIRFFDLDGSNHFAHWDHTREFLRVLADAIGTC